MTEKNARANEKTKELKAAATRVDDGKLAFKFLLRNFVKFDLN